MAHYVDAIDLPIPVEEAFDYLADFSRTVEWDPGVEAARRLTPGAIGLGSRFELTVSFLGRQLLLEYCITEFARPTRLVLVGGDSSVESIDEIRFEPRPGGSRVTYEARLELTGVRRLADPLLDLLFQRIGRLAVRGLRERLAGEADGTPGDDAPGSRACASARRNRRRAIGVREDRSHHRKEGVAR